MIRLVAMLGVVAALAVTVFARPAHADFSACASAYAAKDPHQQIDLYTSCLKHGGLMRTDVAGAFTNRGYVYYQLGEIDKALADFTSAIQYDPNWPTAYMDRASVEAGRGQCAEAQADIKEALKLAPRQKRYLDARDQLAASCPIASKPPN